MGSSPTGAVRRYTMDIPNNLMTAVILWSTIPFGIAQTLWGMWTRGEERFGHYLAALLALLFACLTLLLELFLHEEKLPWLLP